MLRQARITLDRGGCQLQAGLLQFLRGAITIENDVKGVGGFLAGAIKGAMTGETAVKPRYDGTGQIFLEPTFGQMVVMKLDNEEMVVADGMFYAVESTISVQTTSLASFATGLFGGQGFFQTALRGEGFLQTYRGTGEVWVAPTMPVYEVLSLGGLHAAAGTDGAAAAKASATTHAAGGIASLVRAFSE